MNHNYTGSAHPLSDAICKDAQHRLKQRFPKGKPRFGDARDAYSAATEAGEIATNPCISKGLSTMPRRKTA